MGVENPSQKLFAEFSPTSKEQWRQQTLIDLKGAEFDKKLVWRTLDGFDLQPYYDGRDLDGLEYLQNFENSSVNIADASGNVRAWANIEKIKVEDAETANQLALDALNKGADGIIFDLTERSDIDLRKLLNNILPLHCAISFIADRNAAKVIKGYFTYESELHIDNSELQGSINYDPLKNYCVKGEMADDAFNILSEIIEISDMAPKFYGLTINSDQFLNAGASTVQELAFTLNMAVEYIDRLSDMGPSAEKIIRNIEFSMAIGTNYFFEIAKLRALRILFYQLAAAYDLKNYNPGALSIHSHSSIWSKTIFDPHVNMLRNTTEAMSAIIGGCNSISISTYDENYTKPSNFSRRISRNISSVLKEESYLDKVADPSAGSYYVETITDQLVKNAWQLFNQVEAKGGFVKSFETGFIQNEIKKVRELKQQRTSSRRDIYVGSNQYPNLKEHVDPDLVFYSSAIPENAENVLPQQHGAQAFETLRLKTERFVKKHGESNRPKVFLSLVGNNAAMRTARAMFSSGFLGCAGFDIEEGSVSVSLDEAVEKAVAKAADITVICGSDDDYSENGVEYARRFNAKNPDKILVLAGYPQEQLEDLKSAGVDEFIHIRADLIETLSGLQRKLNII